MRTKVMYCSRSGNTEKVAEAIAKSMGQRAENVPPAYPLENVDVLFLGTGVYMGNIDKKTREFIRTLDAQKVKNVAIFGTSGSGKDNGVKVAQELIKAKGINVFEESFVCKGRTFVFVNRSHPNEKDLQDAQSYAKRALESLKSNS